jgi:hypothetical protein
MSQIANAKALYEIAKIAHEMNNAVVLSYNPNEPVTAWESLDESSQLPLVEAVIFYLNNPDVTPEASHNQWLAKMTETHGKVEGPLGVLYHQLSQVQRTKDAVFKAIVESLRTTYDMFYMKALMEADESTEISQAINDQLAEQIASTVEQPVPVTH